MQKVNLPDGRTLKIPNDLSAEKRDELANAVKAEYNIDINEGSLGEWLIDKPKSVVRGLSQMIPTGVKGIAGLTLGSDSDIVKDISDYQRYIATESPLASDPKYRDTFGTKLSEGAGSLIGFGGAAYAGRRLAAKGIVSDKVGRFGVPGALAVPMGMGEQVDRLEQSRALGESPGRVAEKVAILTGGVIGMTELAPIERLFRGIPKNALKNPAVSDLVKTRLRSAAATGTAEAFQEASAGILQNLTAAGLYSDEIPIFDSALEEFTIGGILGASADLFVNSLANRRSISSQQLKDAEERARTNRTNLQSQDKFAKAEEQGIVEEYQEPIVKEKPEIPVPAIVDVAPPDLGVIENPDGQFSVVDYNNIENPIISTHPDEVTALKIKNQEQTNYERKVLDVEVNNDVYLMGMPDSDSAKMLGRTILDPNITQINLSTLIGYDSSISEDLKKELNKEKSATYPAQPYRQMLENKRKNLEKTAKYLESKGLDLKSSFSMPEVKKVLKPADYNLLLESFANHAFTASENAGEPSIRENVDKPDVTIKNIKAIAESKNIELDFKDPAVRYAAKQWTGFEDIPKTRNRGAKELFLARIHSLPAFNTKTKFPDFRPRAYTGLDMANFVASAQDIQFTDADLLVAGPEGIQNKPENVKQFLNDLLVSGRVKKIEGTNKYEITDDFEYTVARRQEGFAQTPDEFRARLERDRSLGKNKLTDEAINNLVASEEIRQERVLPPKELEPKLFDFKETIEEGRTNKFAKELRKKLDKAGLRETGIVVSDDILSTTTLAKTETGQIIFDPRVTRETATEGPVEGEYDTDTDIIFLSLNAVNPDGTRTDEQILQNLDRVLDHEMIHAFREKDLISEKEYQYLRAEVKRKKVPTEYDSSSKNETFFTRSQRINSGTANDFISRGASKERIEEFFVEEAIAEMYRAREFKPVTPKSKGILNRIVEFFKSMGQAMRVSGYKDSSEIFADIESGKIGARERGQVRTLRELDRISMAREQGIVGGLGVTPTTVPDDIATEEDKPVTPDVEAEFGEGVIITPDISFEDVQADKDPITGVELPLGAAQRGGIYDREALTLEEAALDAKEVQAQFPGIGEDAKSVDLLEWMSKSGPSEAYRVIAKRLLIQQKRIEKVGGTKLYTRVVSEGNQRLPIKGHKGYDFERWGGISYAPFTYEGEKRQQIYLKATNFGSSFEVLLHELVHQTTQAFTRNAAFSSDKRVQTFNSELEKIREVLVKQIEDETGSKGRYGKYGYENETASNQLGQYVVYGAANIDELLAEGLTNKRFQDYLEKIPYTVKGKKSLWNKFTESIRKLLNLPAKHDSALSAFLTQASYASDINVGTIKSIYGTGALDAPPIGVPLFSRQNLQQELSDLRRELYDAQSLESADRGYVSAEVGKRNAKRVQDIRNKIERLEEELKQPVTPEQLPLFSRGPRDESSGHLADYVPAQYGPPAHQLDIVYSDEKPKDGYYPVSFGFRYPYATQDIENARREFSNYSTARTPLEQREEREFINKLMEIRGNPNAEITMYQAAPQRDLREGDLITPFLSEAEFLVEESKVTQQEIKDADRARRRQEQIDKTGAVDLQQERLFNQMEGISDILGRPEVTPSRVHTFKLRAGDVRWDGNNGWARWGYFPRIKAVEDLPLFSRQSKTPTIKELPGEVSEYGVNYKITNDELYYAIEATEMSRKGGTRENPGQLDTTIVEIFENNPNLLEASKNFLRKFTNKKGNLIVYRALNIPASMRIKNYGQLPQDIYASATIDHREANQIARSVEIKTLGSKKEDAQSEILRFEVPMDRVKAYVPSLIVAARNKLIELKEQEFIDSGMSNEDEIAENEQYAEEMGEDYNYYDEYDQTIEQGIQEYETELDYTIDEAEVLVDLRGIKPTYQYTPGSGITGREPSITRDIPLFSRARRFTGEANTQEKVALQKSTEIIEDFVKKTPRGEIPLYNTNASDVALKAAYDYINDPSAPTIDELPNYSRVEKEIPEDLQGVVNRGGYVPSKKSWYERLINDASDPVTNIRKFFKDTRQNYIDKLDKVEKKLIQGSEEFEEVRLLNTIADTAAIAALRMSDKARGIFQGMLTRGFPTDVIDGEPALTTTKALKIDTKYNPYIDGDTGTGGLLQITAPLFSDPLVDLEGIFGTYAKLKRVQEFQKQNRKVKSPFTQQDLEFIKNIEANYQVVVEVYNNYQKWNNKLVDFAQAKGLLNEEQAKKWREESTYYPFYRDMVEDEGITAPRIGGGSLPNNPLNLKLKGKDAPIDVPPLEAIARNSLSILTASMKNDGALKLIESLEIMGEAEYITPQELKNKQGAKTIFVFENGFKKHYNIEDPDLFHGIRALGGAEVGFITKLLAMPATLLRDTVTRDPGFIAVNLLRDTLSATVTSGVNLSAPFTGGDGFVPMIDTIKNMFGDISDLEKFGVIGGYDFANDEGDVVDYMGRIRRQQGLTANNGMSAEKAFFYLWDGLGGLTTKSDGATRKGVFDAVYKRMKNTIDERTGKVYTDAAAQSEAAFQALEVINFGRRGLSPMFRVITSAIPFLNARIQGLDVIYRSFRGTYSAQDKLQEGETVDELKNRIMRRTALRGGTIMASTLIYYLLVSDTEEYKEAKRELRDDNWLIPTPFDYTIKIPIPFEIGMMFKALPERFIDLTLGEKVLGLKESVEKDPLESFRRQLGTSASLPSPADLQVFKPLYEVLVNRNSFTGTEIVPYYKLKREPGYQSSPQTNELFRVIGEAFNISPTKIEHVISGYTGTLGGYMLDVVDSLTRTATGSPYIPNNIFSNPTNFAQYPLIKRLVVDNKKMGGLQQQFYELRGEVDRAVSTMNSRKKEKRFDELRAYKSDVKGLMNVKGRVRALERYLDNWRKKRDRLMRRTDISVMVKAEMLQDLEAERDKRLAFIPELRKKANVPIFQGGL